MGWQEILDDTGRAAAKGLSQLGKIGKEKAEAGIAHAKETQWMAKESQRIVESSKQKYQDAQTRLTVAEEDLNDIYDVWLERRSVIQENYLSRFLRLYSYTFAVDKAADRLDANTAKIEFDQAAGNTAGFQGSSVSSSVLTGTAAGVTAAGAAIGLTAVFGTASTGAAISGLSGSAAISATLANLGGGAIAAGGAGIAGGLAVLGGLLVVPAVAVGAYHWDNSVNKNYEKARKYEGEVNAALPKLQAGRDACRKLTASIQSAIFESAATENFLEHILDMFEQDTVLGGTEENKTMATEVFAVVKDLLELQFTLEGEPNPDVDKQLYRIHQRFGMCQRTFGGYLSNLDQQYREALQSVLQQENKAYHVKALENAQIRKQFIRTFVQAREEICILSPWIADWLVDDPLNRRRDTELIQCMRNAMSRGVTIKICYGIGDQTESGQNAGQSHKNSLSNAQMLQKQFASYGQRFRMRQGNSHGKLVICDHQYYLIGSYNFLSFRGSYTGKDRRGEIADYSENQEMLAFYKNHFFAF